MRTQGELCNVTLKMGERNFGERNAKFGVSLAMPALHQMGPISGMHLQDEIEFGLLASEVSGLTFGR